ncbi:MAG: class I SAM-dependent methyltransferase [Solirubrobacterales bacterium]|nr:class I SAM-dependent methyltransferase [Solirubrobacterales bacterium]
MAEHTEGVKTAGSGDAETLREVYDRSSERYDLKRLNDPYKRAFDARERRLLRHHLQETGRALEVGAGTGRLTDELLGVADEVLAVDLSPGMLGQLRDKHPDEPRLRTQIGDVFSLHEVPGYGTFDAVLSMRMVPHLERIEDALEQLAGAVRPGGRLMFDFWNPRSYTYRKKRKAKAFIRYVDAREAKALVAGAGLELERLTGAGFKSPWLRDLEFLGSTPLWRYGWSLVALCRRPGAPH